MVTEDTSSAAAFDPLKTIETYIDGKMRSDTLVFAVNGGAFAKHSYLRIRETPHSSEL